MLDRIEFLFTEALVALRRNGWMTAAAISTSGIALFLLGGLGYVYWRAAASLSDVSGRFEVRVYLKDGASMATIKETATKIRKIEGVRTVNWIPRDKAWERFKQQNPSITEGLDNPFPDGYKVIVTDVNFTRKVGAAIQAMPVVLPTPDGVVFQEDEERFLRELLTLARTIGGVAGTILIITAGVLIFNAIRLTIDARRREIRVMQLVGATMTTVRAPFVIEGTLQGILGGLIATVLIRLSQTGLEAYVVRNLSSTWHIPDFPFILVLLVLSGVGGVFGLFCSSLAVRGPSRFQPKGLSQ